MSATWCAYQQTIPNMKAATTLVEGCDFFLQVPQSSLKRVSVAWMCCRRKLLLHTCPGKLKALSFTLTLLLFRGYPRKV